MLEYRYGGMCCKLSLLFPAVFLSLLLMDHSGTAVLGFTAAILHESGHLLMLALLKERPREIVISFFGMRLLLSDHTLEDPVKLLMVSLAGPAVNALCSVLLFTFSGHSVFAMLHAALGVINLLPILPLDGGQALFAWLSTRLTEERCRVLFEVLFWCVWIPLTLLGIAMLLLPTPNITLCLLCVYLGCLKLFYKWN